jgi:hypothetical protein
MYSSSLLPMETGVFTPDATRLVARPAPAAGAFLLGGMAMEFEE